MRSFTKLLPLLLAAAAVQNAYALTFPLDKNSEVVGEVKAVTAKYEDTFAAYAREYDVGPYQLIRANPQVKDEWLPGEGTEVTIPTQFILPDETRQGVVINLPELRLYYIDTNNAQVSTFPIGIGKAGWDTPLTTTTVTRKAANPVWYVPASILKEHQEKGDPIDPIVASGPDNPLGYYAIYLGIPSYLIHGTNSPVGVGRRVTHGCIRLFPNDIEALFNMLPVGAKVYIVNNPIKAGWKNNELYLEVHPVLEEYPLTENERKVLLVDVIENALNERKADIDWATVHKVMRGETGIPTLIGTHI